MKKHILKFLPLFYILYIFSTGFIFLIPIHTNAENIFETPIVGPDGKSKPPIDPLVGLQIEDVVNNIRSFMTTLGVSLVTIFIIYGGITWMTSGGDPTKIKAGTDTLKWSVIGLAVILMASGIASAVLETLKVKDTPLENGKLKGLPTQPQEKAGDGSNQEKIATPPPHDRVGITDDSVLGYDLDTLVPLGEIAANSSVAGLGRQLVLENYTTPIDPKSSGFIKYSPYGGKEDPSGSGGQIDTGLDIHATRGTVVKNANRGKGTVLIANYNGPDKKVWTGSTDKGQVIVQYEDGTRAIYLHLSSVSVKQGQVISGSTQLGLSGTANGQAHLHMEIKKDVKFNQGKPPEEIFMDPYDMAKAFKGIRTDERWRARYSGGTYPADSVIPTKAITTAQTILRK